MAQKEKAPVRRLNCCMVLQHPSGGAVTFMPGDPLPDWAVELIGRNDVWMDASEIVIEPGKYDDMSVRQLLALAKERELDIETTDRNEIIDALRMWDDAQSDDE